MNMGHGFTPPLKPVYQTTTKSLNTGVQGPVTSTSQVLGIRIYSTAVNGTQLLSLAHGTLFPPGGTEALTAIAYSTLGPPSPPVSNSSGVSNPPTTGAPPVANGPNGSNPAAGTYMLGYTYVTSMGESQISPLTTFVADGAHEIAFGPVAPVPTNGFITLDLEVPRLESWHVTRYAVFMSSAVSQPSINVYIDSVSLVSLLDTSALGAQNSANADLYLRPGQHMIAQWSYADLGATATFSVFGEKTS